MSLHDGLSRAITTGKSEGVQPQLTLRSAVMHCSLLQRAKAVIPGIGAQ
jgi:hypothetical protein